MSRFAKSGRVFFFEEPVYEEGATPELRQLVCPKSGVVIATPVLPSGLSAAEIIVQQRRLLETLVRQEQVKNFVAWYYTPMAREFSAWLRPTVTVYDCMDELSGFAGAPPAMLENEQNLFYNADLVFTGGASLFAAKRKLHSSVYLFPSSVDYAHFALARSITDDPADQSQVAKPRLGYAGVIDERMDLDLIRYIAEQRPDWQIVLIGPVVKIDPRSLPQARNIHYLGMKPYADLPAYFSGWQIGLLPFALNDSTRFISPTKTPEYLAAGLRVVSTAIRDVVSPYGESGLAGIGRSPAQFVEVADSLLNEKPSSEFDAKVTDFLSRSSWDKTWSEMNRLISDVTESSKKPVQLGRSVSEGVAHV